MKQPTYFIEVWSNGEVTKNSIRPIPIEELEDYIYDTNKYEHLQTVAIWKIYPKNKKA